jgi:orotidine-5'-phosphate decarboxylase
MITGVSPAGRLIVALDFSTGGDALSLVEKLDGVVSFYKVGYQLFVSEGMPFVRRLLDRNLKVFLDLKLGDVDETISSAVREISQLPVSLTTLQGGPPTVRAAVRGRGPATKPALLFVSLLSSWNEQDLAELGVQTGPQSGFTTLNDYIVWRSEQALRAGCEGLVASGASIGAIRSRIGARPVIVTPGVRPPGSSSHEHKRSLTPAEAIRAGADYLVVGRPIRTAADPAVAAQGVIHDIDAALKETVAAASGPP